MMSKSWIRCPPQQTNHNSDIFSATNYWDSSVDGTDAISSPASPDKISNMSYDEPVDQYLQSSKPLLERKDVLIIQDID